MADPAVEQVMSLMTSDSQLQVLVEVLGGLNDKQRRALSGPVRRFADGVGFRQPRRSAPVLAVLGCVTGVRQVASTIEWLPLEPRAETLAVQVLRARKPHWLEGLPAALLVGKERMPGTVRLVRALVCEGLVACPDFPEYPLALVRGLDVADGFTDEDLELSVLEALIADPGLLDREVWDVLRTEGTGRELASWDAWKVKPHRHGVTYGEGVEVPSRPERTWQHALVTLAADGQVDRQRLLDETLTACLRDWAASDVGWFVALHDALQPSLIELEARQSTYSRLLAVTPGVPVALALRSFTILHKAHQLNADMFLAAAPAALARADKGPALSALKLLADLGKAEPELAARAAAVVAEALTHDRIDVQERALAVLQKLEPDEVRRQGFLAGATEALAPSLRPPPALPTQTDEASAPAPPDPVAEDLVPVEDADELAELLGRLVEEADDAAEVERLLEGVARLARQRPRRGTTALVQRLHELVGAYYPGAWSGDDLRADLVAVGLVWLDGAKPGRGHRARRYAIQYKTIGAVVQSRSLTRPDTSLAGLVTRRLHEVAKAVSSGSRTLLATPERRDGALSAATLNARIAAQGRLSRPLPLDVGLALLRVPPDEHGDVRLPAAHAKAASRQLGILRVYQPAWELVVGASKGTYDSDTLENAVTWRDRNAPRGDNDAPVTTVLDRRDPLLNLALEAADGEYASRFEQVTALWPLLLPHHPDLLAAHAHPRLVRALTKNRSGTEPLLDALGASRVPFGPPGRSALVLGMAARNGGERAHAVDAVIELARRHRLDGPALGDLLADLLRADAVIGSRLVASLREAAQADAAAGLVVLESVERALPALPGRRDAHAFVDLLAQQAIQHGRSVVLPEPFAAAAAAKGSTVLQKACRRVPQ